MTTSISSTAVTMAHALAQAGPRGKKPKMPPADFAKRLARETLRLQRHYCDAFALWRPCASKICRRRQACSGDAASCLKRALERLPHQAQWRARQHILDTTPNNIGAPERQARQCMPRDLFEVR
jgi:hypothetical protein